MKLAKLHEWCEAKERAEKIYEYLFGTAPLEERQKLHEELMMDTKLTWNTIKDGNHDTGQAFVYRAMKHILEFTIYEYPKTAPFFAGECNALCTVPQRLKVFDVGKFDTLNEAKQACELYLEKWLDNEIP